jgi:SAM-dependent methyltransferase
VETDDQQSADLGWRNFSSVYSRLRPPLKPSPSDVRSFGRAIPGGARVLLLGVTPELAVLGTDLTAIDNSPRMLAQVWPGDADNRRAIIGDWTALPFDDGSFDTVVGDGSLNAAPDCVDEVLAEAARMLAPGGKAAFRLFCSPERSESPQSIREDVEAGWSGNFHALKWRIAMSLAPSRPRAAVPVQSILELFNHMFSDRDQLAAQTGWPADDIATIDAYVDADHSLGFPTLSSMQATLERHFAHVTVVPGTGYALAERCPIVICGV